MFIKLLWLLYNPQIYAGDEQGQNDVGIPRTDDGLPTTALERVLEGDAGATMLEAGSGVTLFESRTGR